MMRRILLLLLALTVVGAAGYGGLAYFWGVPSVEERPTAKDADTIAKGNYLAVLGDCTSCHTVEGGEEFAGGRSFDTPFGTLYSPNITPDPETGIGGMTSAQFYKLLAYGADSVLKPLYPAMPYTSFHYVTRSDSDALHAYFMSLEPVNQQPKANELSFPFNIRPMMFGWNLMFAGREELAQNPDKDASWNRGAYLVRGLGHCGECHTPRNVLGAMESNKKLEGAIINGFEAPDLRASALVSRGWTRDDLVLYFEAGASPQGSAFGDMFLVFKNSLRLMSHDDQLAIATYLMDAEPGASSKGETAVAALGDAAHNNRKGQALYLTNCSLCHGPDGQGMGNTMPPLKGNSAVMQPDGINLITVMAKGLEPVSAGQTVGYGPMPGFEDRLSAHQFADIANYVRDAFSTSGEAPLPLLTEGDVTNILN